MTDHSYIRARIRSHGCRTVAITQNNADVMLYGDYGWAVPEYPRECMIFCIIRMKTMNTLWM